MPISFDDTDKQIERLLQVTHPTFDPTKVALVDSDFTAKDFDGADEVDFLGTVQGLCLLALKAGSKVYRVIAVPLQAYETLAVVLALAVGVQLPQVSEILVSARKTAVNQVAALGKRSPITHRELVQLQPPKDVQLSSATIESDPFRVVHFEPSRLPIGSVPSPVQGPTGPSSPSVVISSTTNTNTSVVTTLSLNPGSSS